MRYIGEICRRRGAHSRFLNHKTEAIASVREAERGRRMFSNGKISSAPSFQPVESPSLIQPMEVLVWQAVDTSSVAYSSFEKAVDKLGIGGSAFNIASPQDIEQLKRNQAAKYRRLKRDGNLTREWRRWSKKHREELRRKQEEFV